MEDLVWINGRVIPFAEATVSIEDRGFQFADGVYEVIRLYAGIPYTLADHLDRLRRSAAGVNLPLPMSTGDIASAIHTLIDATGIGEGMVYLQLTRGPAPRYHAQPADPTPTLLFYTRPLDPVAPASDSPGVRLLSVLDERWHRCWIKSIALLPNTLAKTAAIAAGADEAVFLDEQGRVSECSASNIFAILAGKLITPPVGPKVLPGITRQVLLDLAPRLGIGVEERPFTKSEITGPNAVEPAELFITSTTRELSWVSHWDDQPLAPHCGPLTGKLHEAFTAHRQRNLAARPADSLAVSEKVAAASSR